MLKEGKYIAKVISCGLKEDDGKEYPTVILTYGFKDQDGEWQTMKHYCVMKPGRAKEITAKTLLTSGYQGDGDVTSFAPENCTKLFNDKTEVELDIKNDTYEGRTRLKIKWVNKPGGSGFTTMDSREALVRFKGMSFKSELEAAKKEAGIQAEKLPF